MLRGLNALLPEDIAICHCIEVGESFHARYDVRSKTYRYRIFNHPRRRAVGRHYLWQVRRPLDLSAMSAATGSLIGTHDFKAFEGAGSPRATSVRTIFHAKITKEEENILVFEITGNGFLRFMVRNIVGTLVAVGPASSHPKTFMESWHPGTGAGPVPRPRPRGFAWCGSITGTILILAQRIRF